MKKTILTFGLISGVVSLLMMAVTMLVSNRIGLDRGTIVGYTTIVLSFLLVFFGIRSYRDNMSEGQITFARGFSIGISITLISCAFYVVGWEILYFNFMPDFMDKYAAHEVAKATASGASPARIQALLAQMKHYKELEDNPLTNAAMTFLEPFPVGLIITLISAGILRKKQPAQTAPDAMQASS